MKAYKNHHAEKLLIRFDNELKELLLNDLLQFSFKKPTANGNNQVMTASTLSVA